MDLDMRYNWTGIEIKLSIGISKLFSLTKNKVKLIYVPQCKPTRIS